MVKEKAHLFIWNGFIEEKYMAKQLMVDNYRSANVADNTNSANETNHVEGGVREKSKWLPQEWKEVVALSYGLRP